MTTTTPKDSSNRLFMLAIVAIVVLGLLAVAFLAANRDGLGEIAEQQTDSVEISGDPIAPMPGQLPVTDLSTDPAAGTVAPTLVGTDFLGNEVSIEADGRPKAIYFLAHWCPHCQEEVPVVQDLIDEGRLPEGLDVYGVSTAVDGSRGNFPPQAWLDRADFSPVVLRDDEAGSAFQAYGGSSFPYVVYLDGENRVIARSAGNLPGDSIVSLWESTVAAAPVE